MIFTVITLFVVCTDKIFHHMKATSYNAKSK